MSQNLQFFKVCLQNELNATFELVKNAPVEGLAYRAHPVNRSAAEIIEHIICHLVDMKKLVEKYTCEETFSYPITDPDQSANILKDAWEALEKSVEALDGDTWETRQLDLYIKGNLFVKLPMFQMLWFFFFDMIHHRGQLSSYIRPMGGKVPIIYGSSGDFPTF